MMVNKEELKNAICNGDVNFLKTHKNDYLIDDRFEDEDNDTLLLYSISDSSTEVYNIFLNQNANVHLKNDLGENIIHAIIYSGDIKRLKNITSNYSIDFNHRAKDGATPLLIALSLKNINLAEYLIDLGADVNLADNDGVTPLHLVSQGNDINILQLLLKIGADPFLKTKEGNLPLALAANYGNYDIVKLLFEKTFNR